MDRIEHIVAVCPSLSFQALTLANARIPTLRDPSLYHNVINAYRQINNEVGDLPSIANISASEASWLEATTAINKKNQAERVKLEVELKTYTNNMIKESIRVSSIYSSRV